MAKCHPLVQVSLAPLPAVARFVTIAPSASTHGGCLPLDLAISFNQSEVVVRSAEYPTQAASMPGPDLVRITLATGAFAPTYGGNGVLMELDSLGTQAFNGFVNTDREVLSISEDPLTLLDYVHVAKRTFELSRRAAVAARLRFGESVVS